MNKLEEAHDLLLEIQTVLEHILPNHGYLNLTIEYIKDLIYASIRYEASVDSREPSRKGTKQNEELKRCLYCKWSNYKPYRLPCRRCIRNPTFYDRWQLNPHSLSDEASVE